MERRRSDRALLAALAGVLVGGAAARAAARARATPPSAEDRRLRRERTRMHYERMPFVEGGAARIAVWTRRAARDLPHLTGGATVLDLGCGSGEVAEALRGTGSSVVCLDLTARAAVRAHQRGLPAVRGDALALPFADRSVDHVLA
ncbi:MAG TPA: class I SAM-dependent methyltransferase, partial [Iamia sp.]|nr:class I SAM-dependent methyltransferase [Iamia sp.]